VVRERRGEESASVRQKGDERTVRVNVRRREQREVAKKERESKDEWRREQM
jgi:hypothetical protein